MIRYWHPRDYARYVEALKSMPAAVPFTDVYGRTPVGAAGPQYGWGPLVPSYMRGGVAESYTGDGSWHVVGVAS